jgi:6-pyruvoyltetrahydropterin/6-carboxytetrahydropterin synthase
MNLKKKVAVFRKEHFNAAHRLNNPNWSEQKNKEVFGKCNHPNYHGHNYDLIVKVTGFVDEETGYLMDMKILSDIIKQKVLDRFDHMNLNVDVEDFANLNPTAENIAMVIYNLIEPEIDPALELKILLYETERNYVEYPA